MDRVRRLVVGLVVLVAAGLVILMVTVRPGLRDDAEAVDASWKPLVTQLNARYAALTAARDAFAKAGLGQREVVVDLGRALERWKIASTGTDAEEQVQTAGTLEALAARATALANRPRLADRSDLKLALAAFTKQQPPARLINAYNDQVKKYQRTRDGTFSRIVARLDGYPMRPTLQLLTA